MAKTKLLANVGRTVGRVGLKVKKHSPELLVVAGVVGVVASTVMACKATTRIDDILDESKDKIDAIHDGMETGEVNGTEYTEEDGKKDLAIVYAQSGVKLAKLYGPAIILGTVSIGCIVASHHILRKRNIAIAAAYATVDRGFKEYRGRVVERFGEEMDRELKYNIKAKEIEEKVVDENGEEKIVKKTVQTAEVDPNKVYSRFFDETCTGWTRNAEDNLTFLLCQQNYANERLQAKGHLFLNDVYEMLGLQKSKAGQVVGWYYNKKHQPFIDFGIYDLYDERKRDFVNGYEKSILLNFDPDGNILDYI